MSATANESTSVGKRVYIGNLPFKANAKDIRELLSGFEVVSVNIPKVRTPSKGGRFYFRRLGYAFVELNSPEEAERAVKELEGKQLQERLLSIRIALPPKPKEEKNKDKQKHKESGDDDKGNSDKESGAQETDKDEEAKENGQKSKQQNGSKKGSKKGGAKKPRRLTRREELQSRPDAPDTVFVSGLPKEVTKEEVEELFKDLPVNEVKITLSRPRTIRSKKTGPISVPARAYAFVKLPEDKVTKAIEQLNGQEYKEVTLKVRMAKVDKDEIASGSASVSASASASVNGTPQPEKDTKADDKEKSEAATTTTTEASESQ